VDIGLESSDTESECESDLDLNCQDHKSAGDCDLGPIEGFEDFNKHHNTCPTVPQWHYQT
jgi:hypothetical protein